MHLAVLTRRAAAFLFSRTRQDHLVFFPTRALWGGPLYAPEQPGACPSSPLFTQVEENSPWAPLPAPPLRFFAGVSPAALPRREQRAESEEGKPSDAGVRANCSMRCVFLLNVPTFKVPTGHISCQTSTTEERREPFPFFASSITRPPSRHSRGDLMSGHIIL